LLEVAEDVVLDDRGRELLGKIQHPMGDYW
jgi:hypothetical protein